MHLFYYLVVIEIFIAVAAYTNVAEYAFMPIKQKTVSFLSDSRLHIYLILSLSVIFFFHAFKNPMTLSDIPDYAKAFDEAKQVSLSRVVSIGYESLKTEIGFAVVIKVLSSLFQSSQILFFLTSAFILSSVYFTVKKYSPLLWVSVFIFMTDSFPQSLFILRAFIAISIYLFAFPFIINRKMIPFLLFSGIAFSIHMSSIIFLPVYFLYGIKNWRFLLLVLMMIAVTVIIGGLSCSCRCSWNMLSLVILIIYLMQIIMKGPVGRCPHYCLPFSSLGLLSCGNISLRRVLTGFCLWLWYLV